MGRIADLQKRGLECGQRKAYDFCVLAAYHWPLCGANNSDHAKCTYRKTKGEATSASADKPTTA